MGPLAVDVSDHYPISINCDTDCEQRIDTGTKVRKIKINWEKVNKECYSKMVNQEITNRKVIGEAQKLESNYGIENMIIEVSNILRDCAKKMYAHKINKRRNWINFKYGIMIYIQCMKWNRRISNGVMQGGQKEIIH